MNGYTIYKVSPLDGTAQDMGTYESGGVQAFEKLVASDWLSEYTMFLLVSVFSADDDHDWHVERVGYEGRITDIVTGEKYDVEPGQEDR